MNLLLFMTALVLGQGGTEGGGGGGGVAALDTVVTLLMPVLAVAAGRYLYEGIQVIAHFVDAKLPAVVHAVALVVVQFALIQLAQMLGIPLPEALSGFTPEIATAAATAGMGMGWHALSKKKEVALLAAVSRSGGGTGTGGGGGAIDRRIAGG